MRLRRPGALLASVAINLALVAMLALGWSGGSIVRLNETLATLNLAEPPPPPPPPEPVKQVPKKRAEGAASPPNLRSRATEIVAPPPIIPLPVPSPVIVAPRADIGVQASTGSAEVRGPGTGAGGEGNGRGSGGAGDGDGGGGDDDSPPRHLRGRLKDSDYPRGLGEAGVTGRVGVRYLVGVDGRVGECRITGSSGSDVLDSTTCRLIVERFRFEPSRDGAGRPVPSWLVENHEWLVERAREER